MPNRTVYLPKELDEVSRQLGLNLSQLTQAAIEQFIEQNADAAFEAKVAAAMARSSELAIDWPEDALAASRSEAGER